MDHNVFARGRVVVNDRLVIRWWDRQRKHLYFQGKRVGKSCPLTREEVRAYVTKGAITCVRVIRQTRGLSLRDALDLLNSARR